MFFNDTSGINTQLGRLEASELKLDRFISGDNILSSGGFVTEFSSKGNLFTRETRYGDFVDCYRNLNKSDFFSVKQKRGENKNLVSGYANTLVVSNPQFIVGDRSRQRVLKERRRNVHAFVRGHIVGAFSNSKLTTLGLNLTTVTYSPWLQDTFFYRDNEQPIQEGKICEYAILHGANVYLVQNI